MRSPPPEPLPDGPAGTARPAGRPAAAAPWRRRLAWSRHLLALALRNHPPRFAALGLAFAVVALALTSGLAAWQMGGANDADARPAELVAFLRDDLPDGARRALAEALRGLPGIAAVRLLGSDEALARMRVELGSRAAVLDGVEEGFLPASLEISLGAGADGGGRADALAWRLRRMDGVAEVDLLRSPLDDEMVATRDRSRALRAWALVGSALLALGAVRVGFVAMRQLRRDAVLLAGLGFAVRSWLLPVALLAAVGALLGTLVGVAVWSSAGRGALAWARAVAMMPPAGLASLGPTLRTSWRLGALAALAVLGGALGWWGARPSDRQLELLEHREPARQD